MPFVEWDPREFNSEADHAANAALDADMDWERVSEVPQADRWRLSVDGAYRRGAKAAAGVVLHCYNSEGDRRTVARYEVWVLVSGSDIITCCRVGRVGTGLGEICEGCEEECVISSLWECVRHLICMRQINRK